MSRTAYQGLAMVGAFVALLVLAAAATVDLDAAGARGVAIGVGLGLVNIGAGYLATRWASRRGLKQAMTAAIGGFAARFLVLASLTLVFGRGDAVDPGAFALTFMVFFFVYVGVEMLQVERSAARRATA